MLILIFITSFLLILLNFTFYLVCFRYLSIGKSELGIFLYQLVSLIMLIFLNAFITYDLNLETLILSVIFSTTFHGIYSLSFLEIWSLSEGGYSLQILNIIDKYSGSLPDSSFRILVQVGDEKKKDRIKSLAKLNLINLSGDEISLTGYGKFASYGIKFVRTLANIYKAG